MSVLVAIMATLAALAGLSAPADALTVQRAQEIAVEHWGGQPPCGEPVVTVERELRDGFGRPAGGIAFITECRVALASATVETDGAGLCLVMVHEYGHLFGLGHAPASATGDVMTEGRLDIAASSACQRERDRAVLPFLAAAARVTAKFDHCVSVEQRLFAARRKKARQRLRGNTRRCWRRVQALDRLRGALYLETKGWGLP